MELLRINLKTQEYQYSSIKKKSKYFLLGGRGITSQIIYDEVDPHSDPFSKLNKLIIANGLLTGSPFPNSGRTSIGSKSPLTNGIKEANVGGRGAYMLAQQGIRAIILEDIAKDWIIIIINNREIEIIRANEYKGLNNYNLCEKLYKKYGNRIGIYSIGTSGENLLKSSTIACNSLEGHPSRHAARGGLGSVMGSKKLKAIVIIPSKINLIKIDNIKEFRKISKPLAKLLYDTKKTLSKFGTPILVGAINQIGGLPTKNYTRGKFKDVENISGEKLYRVNSERGGFNRIACCPTCVIKCSNIINDKNGNYLTSSFEYETIAMNGSNLLINNIDELAKIDFLCDDIGIDTIEFGATIGVAMYMGKIKWGDSAEVIKILRTINENSIIGELYGNGVYNFGKSLNIKRIPQVKGQSLSGYDPRIFKAMGVTYATSPMGADHTAGAAIAGRNARKDFDYGDLTEDKHKLQLSYELQLYTTVLDSMGCCYFIGPSFENMEIIAKCLNAMYRINITQEDVINIGKNTLMKELEYNEKVDIKKECNKLPSFFYTEELKPSNHKTTFNKKDFYDFWNYL
ncbi:MAG: aldehyde ferredoxin oxidoreductase [Candidatus Lokiarchaeota archaeon]|nr:aldehyde ferredoxin oxidoreductase [Candidatus Lokiarchaeota archaeon]